MNIEVLHGNIIIIDLYRWFNCIWICKKKKKKKKKKKRPPKRRAPLFHDKPQELLKMELILCY